MTKTKSSSKISKSAKVTNLIGASNVECSPAGKFSSGAKVKKSPLLNAVDQAFWKENAVEIKQLQSLVIAKCGLEIAEKSTCSQKLQEDYFSNNFDGWYQKLCKNSVIGNRMARVPIKYLYFGTSSSTERLSGSNLRKRYSTLKTFVNNTLNVKWNM